MPAAHNISYSSHKLYHEALRWSRLFVRLGTVYGIALVVGAIDVLLGSLGSTAVPILEGGNGPEEMGHRQGAALGLATAGVMGLLIALLVSISRYF